MIIIMILIHMSGHELDGIYVPLFCFVLFFRSEAL